MIIAYKETGLLLSILPLTSCEKAILFKALLNQSISYEFKLPAGFGATTGWPAPQMSSHETLCSKIEKNSQVTKKARIKFYMHDVKTCKLICSNMNHEFVYSPQ